MPEALPKSRYVASCRVLLDDCGFSPSWYHFLTSSFPTFPPTHRLLKSEFPQSEPNKRDEDAVEDEETGARSLPCLRTFRTINPMTRLAPPFHCHPTIHPPPHPQSNTTKSKGKTITKRRTKSRKPNKTIRRTNQRFHWRNNQDTLHWIAKWLASVSGGNNHLSLA